ncbi:MAG: succinyl-diaminopimelate desuccinylase [Candidatus Paracaedimonas acanthamoebae]|uniref:Succinyl-diaminopimelate desuccinylase n=1 Tax=Candidatus Paracaedimonas acanthamoebae TaxID=244581 RepID=A0A8J7PL72_9PROT|nr:succinyl-diaminopimelate desuccinylase [Candidatus Paracaedimonas acanthamoebae]
MNLHDPIILTQRLIQCPSITPLNAGALEIIETALKILGFTCYRQQFDDVDNLYARLGDQAPNFCFAGHIDVVPTGSLASWTYPPFDGKIINGILYGRGTVDMKGGIGAFISAIARFLEKSTLKGSISFLLTSDEEGPAINGTLKMLEWLDGKSEKLDVCLVGEPTSDLQVGDIIKYGSRGSLNTSLKIQGTQGHVAYPDLADNPLPRLIETLSNVLDKPLDQGCPHFQPSNVEITSIDVDNEATNMIPQEATARFNIRFNTLHTSASLKDHIQEICRHHAGVHSLDFQGNAEAFVSSSDDFLPMVIRAIEAITPIKVKANTSGGTSDARFIYKYCPVLELGLRNQTAHKIDECVPLTDLESLTQMYEKILRGYFDL